MSEKLLEVKNLRKVFTQRKGLMSFGGKSAVIPAVDDISFEIHENETLGLVGESGCGKTTTGKAILKLSSVTDGNILYRGQDITAMSDKDFRPLRGEIQMIFQDLDAALNPKIRIHEILRESIVLHNPEMAPEAVDKRILELMELVNLNTAKLTNFPSELSGGEKRRVGIARVLSVNPKFIVADEPTSALDVSIQAQVINLMRDLQNDFGLSYLFISHDLQLVELISHRVAVMYLGRIVEIGPSEEIVNNPRHPYTAILWSSLVEMENREAETEVMGVSDDEMGGVQDYERPTTGCRFAPRCPTYLMKGRPAKCTAPESEPQLKDGGNDHRVACHFPL